MITVSIGCSSSTLRTSSSVVALKRVTSWAVRPFRTSSKTMPLLPTNSTSLSIDSSFFLGEQFSPEALRRGACREGEVRRIHLLGTSLNKPMMHLAGGLQRLNGSITPRTAAPRSPDYVRPVARPPSGRPSPARAPVARVGCCRPSLLALAAYVARHSQRHESLALR